MTHQYLETFFAEKNLPHVEWELQDKSGMTHFISNEVVIETILNSTPRFEQNQIAGMIRKLDFLNYDVNNYLKHLAGALINA